MESLIAIPRVKTLSLLHLIFLSGCAHHMPMSELKMYQEKRYSDGETQKTGYAHVIAGASASYAALPDPLVTRRGKVLYNPQPAGFVGMSSVFMRPLDSNFATSISYGLFTIGFDTTFELYPSKYDNLYFTAGFSGLPINYQVILQRRFLDGNPIGLSLGVQVKQLQLFYDPVERCSGFSCNGYSDNFVAFGPRATFVLSGNPNPAARQRAMIYTNISANYAPHAKLYYLNFGMAMVIH